MTLKDRLKKAAGLFMEFDEDPIEATAGDMSDMDIQPAPPPSSRPEPKTVEQIVRESPGPNLDEIQVPATVAPPVIEPGKQPDFTNIYRQANLPAAPFTAEQMLELIGALPTELPLETKRQTVRVTLSAMTKTMGVTADGIVTDASRKLAALAAFADNYTKQASEFVVKSRTEIAQLEAEIEQKRKAITSAETMQTHVTEVCQGESDRLDEVLEFFSMDLPPSKHAPPAG